MPSITGERTGEFIKAAFKVIIENGGQLQVRKIFSLVEEKMEFTDYELERFKKSGQIRWQNNLQWYTVDCVYAGWLRKKNGVWYITPEGEEAMKLSPKEFMNTASKAFKKAKAEKEQREAAETSDANTTEESADRSRITAFENAVEQATDEIREFIIFSTFLINIFIDFIVNNIFFPVIFHFIIHFYRSWFINADHHAFT